MKDMDWFGTSKDIIKIGAGIAIIGAAINLLN